MSFGAILTALMALLLLGYYTGRKRSISLSDRRNQRLHSLPQHYGYLIAFWSSVPALLILLFWSVLESSVINSAIVAQLPAQLQQLSADELELFINEIINLSHSGVAIGDDVKRHAVFYYNALIEFSDWVKSVIVFVLAFIGMFIALAFVKPEMKARNLVERLIRWFMIGCASIAVLTTIGIIFSVIFESIIFFKAVNVFDFLFGTHWSPQEAIREDQVGGSGSFGALPLFIGTLLISFVALVIAVPLGLMSAIYLSEYSSPRFRLFAKPVLEMLAGIPTVVYGFFAAITVAPFIRDLGESLGLSLSSESALAAGIVMGVMIIPFVSSLSDDVISAVPQAMRDGSYAMGATKSETIKQVIIPAALPGIVSGVLLAASRAIGETMIVVMAAGLSANLTFNPLEAVTTVTVQMVALLTGDQEFDSTKTLAAFALGLGLFLTTLVLNIISLYVVRKYREQYD
ncbi:Phosphate transport system permease protein PstC (TC 3.A.1.7.1) [uncultured Gammaproteobacteria bacterium]|jgi:phosphate transport system permease protein|uniref:phosphate ABC transporter permease subunit PstC n=1 Tax=thiotrophic endosymbiont of Bathymodiolus puteoserpentis (Logatchev) TaxID=343240 RepID=UPI0010B964D9|nr:Phosphate transport system permease protein PstC (TC 3.A.1.7.1) [uncultured Gammaproteobacteria bacterium]SSC10440.1 Phosphate transport system permease protein PstC (TC 3.A.1.7.1) [thiotrophic endosymbiont of Bathymodiolus puteoserpentis (Logatchev)]CAC9499331.1 Phosphate transport system permease protein PstC (TC 3.A.1.7.1) [uncultured Gammaproteobacteria bacterium]CAC9651361.1 Phosphate ABC transporter, permease protein PstC (TC 3.A.1.7.1) [uncultured Gammaproteobacteria bacterium]CAC9985